jgi:PKD repeat protein
MNKKILFTLSIISLLCLSLSLNAQFRKKPNFDYTDPNENFYVTQKRFNKYFKEHEKEEARERLAKSQGKNPKVGYDEEEEMGGYELYKRWEDFMAPRVYPSGDKTLASKAYEEYMKYINQSAGNRVVIPNSIMSTTWQPIGPFGDLTGANAGRLNGIRFDPSSSTGYWACAPDGGLWSSTNSGSSWTTNTDALTAIGCSDVVFDPTNSQNIYMASGDGDAGDCYSIGVLKSTNGGLTWAATGLAWTVSQGRLIHKLLINPLNKKTIFAATNIGLLRTQDGGTNWTTVQAGNVYDVEYRPGDTTTVYACSTSFFKSTNGGTTWSTITTGLAASGVQRYAIAVTPANSAFVYVVASASSNSGFLGFWQSTNNGTSFTQISTTLNLLGWASAGNDTGGQGWYTLSIAASPTNANEVCVGGVNIWRTTNAGAGWSLFAHWTGSGAPYVHADIHDIIYKNGTSIYISCDGGGFYTTNSGTSFFSMNGNMNIAQVYKIGNSATTYSRAITGHQDNGTNLFTGGWSGTMGGDGMDCFIDRTNDNVMYGEQYQGAFNRTTNGGASWTGITTGMTGTGAWVTPWHQDPVVANTIYGGRVQLFKSTNQGTNWSQIGTMPGTGAIVEFAVAPSNTQIIYVIKSNAVYKTINGGTSWTTVTGTLPVGSAALTSIIVENDDPNSVWVSFSGYSTGNKVFQSTDGAATWTNYSTGLPNLPTNRVLYWNGTKDGIYAGCDVGVYFRDSTMSSWVNYSAGLPNVQVHDLGIFYPLGKLRAATYGRGVWEVDLYNTGTMAPIAGFTSDKQYICPTMTVNFTDQSSFSPTSWSWVFQGGSPATSTVQNPSIVYNTAGTYSVQLTAINGIGSSVATKTMYITVTSPTTIPMVEGFQGATFPPTGWQNYDAANNTIVWQKNAAVGRSSTASLMFDDYNQDVSNTRDEFRSPKYNFTGYTNLKMYFDVAYARYDPTYSDSLEVLVSTNCGQSYTSLYLKGGTTLATSPDVTAQTFTPTAAQWRTDTIYLNAYAGMGNVMFSFMNRGHYGQAMYIDNINITGALTSIPPTASFSYAAANPCAGQNVSFSDMSTGSPTAWSWTLTGASPSTSSVKNPTVSYTSAGTYTVTMTSTNAFGTSSPVSQVITVNPIPTVAATSASATICNGQSVTLTASGATSYSWNTGPTTNTVSVSPTSNTTYTVTGTTSGCSNSAIVSVTVNASPTVAVTAATVCAGTPTTITASGASTYSWNTGATSAAISVTPATTTNYTVIGTTAGCTNTKTTSIVANAVPTVAANSATICSGQSANLTASGATTYSWSTGATTATIVSSPTIYTVFSVTGTTSGCTNTKTVSITVNALPSVNATASSTNLCAGQSSTLTGTGAASYTWNPGSITGNPIAVTPASNITYTCVGTGTNGCSSLPSSVNITVNSLPTVTSNSASICSGSGSATLTASGAASYTWNTSATTAAIIVNPTVTTNYTVTGTNAAGCTNTYTTMVGVAATPTVTANSATVCAGNSTNLTANGATTYSWSTGATTSSVSVTPTISSVYSFTGTTAGCVGTGTTAVTVNALPSVSLSASSNNACTSSTGGVPISLTGSPSGGTYSGPGVVGSTFTTQVAAGNYTATYSYTDVNGCNNTSAVTISVSVCTGIAQVVLNNDGSIDVLPNPNNGIFTINANISEKYDVVIYNAIGQVIRNFTQINRTVNVDLSEFGKGIYNVVLNIGGTYKNVKVIVQ